MFRTLYLLAAFLCVTRQAAAQNNVPAFSFPFSGLSSSLSEQQKQLADSLYESLADGEKIQLVLLSPAEEKGEKTLRAKTSYQRAFLLMEHYRLAGLNVREFCTLFVPFDMPNTMRSNDLSRASSISMGRKSTAFVLLSREPSMATSSAAIHFDNGFDAGTETFYVNQQYQMCISLVSGTTICIPANSLQFSNGQQPGCKLIKIEVSEYLSLEAAALKAMSTTSSGRKLETGGMWHIGVSCNGEPLEMKPGLRYTINVAFGGERKNMRVFTGRLKGGLLDWKEETDDRVLPADSENRINGERFSEMDGENEEDIDSLEYRFDNQVMDGSNVYSLQLNDFGWINCDAFSNAPEVANLMVMGEVDKHCNVMLVYGARKSILPGYLCEDGKTVTFSNLSTEETAMLVVFKKKGDKGDIEKFTRLVQPGKEKNIRVTLSPSSADNLRTEIRGALADL